MNTSSEAQVNYHHYPLDRQAIAACASNHVIPFDLVGDPVFQWAYGVKCRGRKKVSDRVTELAKEWRQSLKENMSGSSVSIILDGWTNSINGQHHLCFVVGKSIDMFYWSSVVVEDKSVQGIFQEIEKVVREIRLASGCVVCVVADNARNIQAALKLTKKSHPEVTVLGCLAHIMNLIIGDIFSKVSIVSDLLKILDELTRVGILPRYSAVRWTSKFECLQTAISRNNGDDHEKLLFSHSNMILAKVSRQIFRDSASIKEALTALILIEKSWASNKAITNDTKIFLIRIKQKRLNMVMNLMNSLSPFLNLDDDRKRLLEQFTKNDQNFKCWALAVLPDSRKDGFGMERTDLRDREVLTDAIQPSSFPLHCTLANLPLKCPISEAFVERAFSKHKLFHSKLRASLSDGKLNDQLFVRYNFAKVLKIAETSNLVQQVENKISSWVYVSDDSESE